MSNLTVEQANQFPFVNGCVKGYITLGRRPTENSIELVQHVALFPNGTIKISNEHPTNTPHFNQKHWKWEEISEMPENLEWIGNYPANM
jgi:hypothetical protein